MTLFPSACVWGYRNPSPAVFHEIKNTGFHYVDIETEWLDVPGVAEALKETGLKVSCVALDHKLPAGCSMEGMDSGALRKALDYLRRGLERCHAVGAQAAYLASCRYRKNLKAFSTGVEELAKEADSRKIRLCVEHMPGRALATAKDVLSFVKASQVPGLYLLLDTGHALISGEKPWEVAAAAGGRLGYVQMNDNNGKRDKHWALLDGRMTRADLVKTLEALQEVKYEGTLGLELNDDRASVICGLSKNRNLLLRLQLTAEPKSMKEPETRRKQ